MQTNANAEISIIRSSRLVETGGYCYDLIFLRFYHATLVILEMQCHWGLKTPQNGVNI